MTERPKIVTPNLNLAKATVNLGRSWPTLSFETNENCVPKRMVNNGDNNDIIEKNRCEDREEYKQSRTSL